MASISNLLDGLARIFSYVPWRETVQQHCTNDTDISVQCGAQLGYIPRERVVQALCLYRVSRPNASFTLLTSIQAQRPFRAQVGWLPRPPMTANDDACLIGLMVPLMNESWDEWFDKVRDQYEAELDECHTKYGKGPWTVPYMQDDGWRKPPARQLARKSCGRHPPSLGTQRTPNQGSPSLAETQGKDDSDENDDESEDVSEGDDEDDDDDEEEY